MSIGGGLPGGSIVARAARVALRAIGRWPDLLPAHLGLGSAALALGRFDEAESALAAALALAPDAPEVVDLEQRLRARLQGP